uniref:Uncharacterized protein n=1 Tax=Cacopsylla melanoneura TaxID=428564 RepID=A0A8D8M064_9HEMI
MSSNLQHLNLSDKISYLFILPFCNFVINSISVCVKNRVFYRHILRFFPYLSVILKFLPFKLNLCSLCFKQKIFSYLYFLKIIYRLFHSDNNNLCVSRLSTITTAATTSHTHSHLYYLLPILVNYLIL